jgi:hypothetical protein
MVVSVILNRMPMHALHSSVNNQACQKTSHVEHKGKKRDFKSGNIQPKSVRRAYQDQTFLPNYQNCPDIVS